VKHRDDRNSGLALSLLAEKDDTPLGPMAKDQAHGWARIAEMTLSLYKMNAESTQISRSTTIVTENGVPHAIQWNAKDIDEKPKVIVPLDATMPRSKIATQSLLTGLSQQFPQVFQNINARSLASLLGLPDPKTFLAQLDPDGAKAEWENGLLMQSIPIIPEDFDVHDIHIKIHNDERKSTAYELMPQEQRQYLDLHIQAHMQYLTNERAAIMAQADQAEMGEQQDPGVSAALESGIGLPLPGQMPAGEMGAMPTEQMDQSQMGQISPEQMLAMQQMAQQGGMMPQEAQGMIPGGMQ